jgi:hypothetical protein
VIWALLLACSTESTLPGGDGAWTLLPSEAVDWDRADAAPQDGWMVFERMDDEAGDGRVGTHFGEALYYKAYPLSDGDTETRVVPVQETFWFSARDGKVHFAWQDDRFEERDVLLDEPDAVDLGYAASGHVEYALRRP